MTSPIKRSLGALLMFLVVYVIALLISGGAFVDALKVCGLMICALGAAAALVGVFGLAMWLLEG